MDSASAHSPSPGIRGEVRFVDGPALARFRAPADAASMLFVDVGELGPSARGQLAEFLEAAVEEAIQRRGAAPPGVGASSDWDASLSDQLFRARHLGVRGLAVALGPLGALAGHEGVLDPEDSAALAFWAAATKERPVALWLDESSRTLAGYRSPVRLDDLVGVPTPPPTEAKAPKLVAAVTPSPEPVPAMASPKATSPEVWVDNGEWRAHAEELRAARGPKPLGQVERLFVTRYVPLAEAELHGVVDAPAKAIRAEWATSFAKSYGEAFAALRVTGKRPTMVFDAPQLAARIARLHGARAVELLLVDGMRFDVGMRIHERLRHAVEGHAACAERLLLWSALPSTTTTQLDLLAHGLEGLSRPLADESDVVARGRSVGTLRRVKVGTRDLLKLDSVEARLREAGGPIPERLDTIADEAAQIIARHMASLPDRTLLLVFGDHGFLLDAGPTGSNPARQGGASPEEILVPGFAWLTGGVH